MSSVAFTLAEVLIVMSIIGIVAEVTIPALVKSTQDAEFKSSIKKTFSVLIQAQSLVATENGGQFSYAIANCADSTCFKNLFRAKLRVVRECDGVAGCFTPQSSMKFLNKTTYTDGYGCGAHNLILRDGTALDFWMDTANCSTTRGTISDECGWITVDVNGLKNPNTLGRDVYIFYVSANKVFPNGPIIGSPDDCGAGSNLGYACAQKYIMGN